MKKILIFSVAYHPFVGGAEVAVKEITDRISDISFDVITLNLDGKQLPEEKVGNIMVYRIGGPGKLQKLLFTYRAYLKAKELHRKNNYDAIWSIMASFSGFAASFFKAKYPKIPFILSLQEGDPIEYIKSQVWFVYPLFKKIFTRANVVLTISNFLAHFAKDMGAQGKIIVVPNGVDIKKFGGQFSDAELDVVRTEIGKEPGDRIMITTSRLVIKNGISDTILALKFLPTSVKLVIIGVGELEQSLKYLAEKNKLSSRVLFLGQKPNDQLPKYLAVSDVFVRPSLSEGMGVSFIEAMAAGVPVVATNVGGIPDFLQDKQTGLFCLPHNPEDVAKKVMMILENQTLKNYITDHATSIINYTYEWQTIAERIDKILLNPN